MILILPLQVVEDTSSSLGLPTIEITEHIGRNHMDMCRFTGSNDFEYRKVASALGRMANSISKQPIMVKKSTYSREQTRLLLESLRFDQINARQMTIKKAHVKTCKWLYTKSEYLDWLDQTKLSEHHGFLWIKGKPGTGKSTLMKYFLANSRKLMKGKVVISFFFNARGEGLEKSTLGTYQSLLLQLLERIPTLESVFETLDLSVRTNGAAYQWSEDSLKTLLEEAILTLGDTSVVCLIDALDECDERQIRDMISFLEHVGELAVSDKISFQVCFSSRHYPHITIESGITLILEGQEGHTHDITSYLESELKIGNSKVAKQVRDEVQEKASGVFLWVVLVVEILNKEHDSGRIPALRRRLREIPGDLHELFNDILTRDSRNRDELILCVQWVLFARHPLTPEQLYFAIISGSEPQDLSLWDPDEMSISDIQRFILNASKGLAETTTSKTPTVQFIHESVKDFLVKENGLGKVWSDLGNNFEGQSHEKLKQCCVNYLNIDFATNLGLSEDLPKASSEEAAQLRGLVNTALPFLEYATHHVLYHADIAQGRGVIQENFIQEFQLTRWIWLNNLFEKHQVRRHTPKASLLYLLAEYDMSNLIKINPYVLSLFETGDERYGCPLFASLATGSDRAILSFLEACVASQPSGSRLQQLCQQFFQIGGTRDKVGRNFQFPKHGNIFLCIAEWSHKTLFGIAYEMVDINLGSKSMHGRSPLSLAAEMGHEPLAERLLNDEAVVDAKDQSGRTSMWLEKDKERTPLMLAAENGHEAIVKLLLENNAAIDLRDIYGSTPLMLAAMNGREAVVRMLLENEAAIDLKNSSGQTSLMLAVANGHEAIAKLLLEHKAAIESKNSSGKTPLMLAAANGYEAMIKLLLENKAAKDSHDMIGSTALLLAAENGHEAVVTVLLQSEAALESKNTSGQTTLMLAAKYGHEANVKLLLKRKAVIDSKDNSGLTPLAHAARGGSMNVVQLLLDSNEVDVDSKDREGDTPLSLATRYGHNNVVKLLLDTGKIDVNSKNQNGYTPLLYAAQYGYNNIIKQLLKIDTIDLHSRNHDGDTPLSLAAMKANVATVKLLLDTGKFDVNSKDNAGESPLMEAIRYSSLLTGCETVVKLLLDTGKIDVHAKNHVGQTAQMIAAAGGYTDMIQLLENYVVSPAQADF